MAEKTILEKTRLAGIAYLSGVVPALLAVPPTAKIFNGKSSQDKTAPCIIVDAIDAQEDPPNTGNFWVILQVSVKSIGADDPAGRDQAAGDEKAASDTLTADVFQALDQDDLAAQLSAALPNYTVQGLGEHNAPEEAIDGDCWAEIWQRRIYCAGSDL